MLYPIALWGSVLVLVSTPILQLFASIGKAYELRVMVPALLMLISSFSEIDKRQIVASVTIRFLVSNSVKSPMPYKAISSNGVSDRQGFCPARPTAPPPRRATEYRHP